MLSLTIPRPNYLSSTSASYFCLNQETVSSLVVLWELPTVPLHLFLLVTLAPGLFMTCLLYTSRCV